MEEGALLVEDTPENLFDNPEHPRLKQFLAKVL
jgi:polar amino acid transport system ATP-binding protein